LYLSKTLNVTKRHDPRRRSQWSHSTVSHLAQQGDVQEARQLMQQNRQTLAMRPAVEQDGPTDLAAAEGRATSDGEPHDDA
jgi:hypothetical protein